MGVVFIFCYHFCIELSNINRLIMNQLLNVFVIIIQMLNHLQNFVKSFIKLAKKAKKKMNKKWCQVIAFVYIRIMEFPNEKSFIPSIVTKNFFSNVISTIEQKISLHCLHVTGQINGYFYSFCNSKVRENKYVFLF